MQCEKKQDRAVHAGGFKQGVVTFIRPIELSATGIKIFDGQKFYLDRLIDCLIF